MLINYVFQYVRKVKNSIKLHLIMDIPDVMAMFFGCAAPNFDISIHLSTLKVFTMKLGTVDINFQLVPKQGKRVRKSI